MAASPTTLDIIGAAHDTDGLREDRIARHKAERDQWHAWLADHTAREEADMDATHRASPDRAPRRGQLLWVTGTPEDPYADYVDGACRRRYRACRARRPNPEQGVAAYAASVQVAAQGFSERGDAVAAGHKLRRSAAVAIATDGAVDEGLVLGIRRLDVGLAEHVRFEPGIAGHKVFHE